MAADQNDVLIVGAGPVGMTLALQLRRYGVGVTIVDREAETGRYTRAAVLWPRTLEILDFLGIVADWEKDIGVPLHAFTFTVDQTATELDLTHIASPHPRPMGFGQDRSEALLDKRLKAAGADYRRGVSVAEIKLEADGATAVLHGPDGAESTVRSSWIVGCDGSNSRVREAAGIARKGDRNAGVQIIQGDVRIQGSLTQEPGRGYLWVGQQHAMLLVIPIQNDGHYRVLVTLPDDGSRETPTLDQLQEKARHFLPDITLRDPIWLSRFRTQHQIAESYRAGRAFVVGDAAHVWVPIGAQGMNIGMQDAFDLGWKLAGVVRGALPESVLDTYTAERHPIGVQNIALTEQIYGALLAPDSLKDTALRHILPHLVGLAPISERMTQRFAELDMHYPPSLLVHEEKGHSGGLAAGVRAPDAYVNRCDTGQTVRLYDLYREGKWNILGWAIKDDDHAVAETLAKLPAYRDAGIYLVDATRTGLPRWGGVTLRDLPQLAAHAYGVERAGIHVVRPDGVIGYRGPVDAAALQRYLAPLLAS